MTLLTEDIVYKASVGPEPGQTYRGAKAVRVGIEALWLFDDALSVQTLLFEEFGDVAFAQWRYSLRDRGHVVGIDRLEFRSGLICLKDGYRKTRVG